MADKKYKRCVMKKAVFFDIDGTLWDEHGVIPKSTREGIKRLRENGILAFICSGRTRGFIRDERLLSLGFDGMIGGCGTYIEYDGDILYYHRLDNKIVHKGVEVLTKYQMPFILEGKEYLYIDDRMEGIKYAERLKADMGEYLLPVFGNEDSWEVSKFSTASKDESYLMAIQELAEHFDCLVHGMHAIEFVPKGFSKASGIQKACELLDIPQEGTYAFGDSVNDLEMLSFVAHGVAMGNGTKEAKETAEYITAPLLEDGIWNGLEHYGLL